MSDRSSSPTVRGRRPEQASQEGDHRPETPGSSRIGDSTAPSVFDVDPEAQIESRGTSPASTVSDHN